MNIDKGSFFLAVGTLAAGGAGGYYARDRGVVVAAPTPLAATAAPSPSGSAASSPPPCDDLAGAPADCPPPPYSAEEGGCGPALSTRCAEFKQTMKPRVAERAVACVLALDAAQRCDPARVNLCGHAALMNACSAPATAEAISTGGDAAAVVARCHAITQACPSANERDCEATLTGMTALGRERMASCISTHCSDKGLLGCEAASGAK
jgi:hypothetical protein